MDAPVRKLGFHEANINTCTVGVIDGAVSDVSSFVEGSREYACVHTAYRGF